MITSNIPAGNGPAVNLPLGQLVSTPGALDALAKAGRNGSELFDRHRRGGLGEVDAGDCAANDRAVADGDRILSDYLLKDQTKVWIITEADRSVTTLLLPDEY
jgi:hypothetical protein